MLFEAGNKDASPCKTDVRLISIDVSNFVKGFDRQITVCKTFLFKLSGTFTFDLKLEEGYEYNRKNCH